MIIIIVIGNVCLYWECRGIIKGAKTTENVRNKYEHNQKYMISHCFYTCSLLCLYRFCTFMSIPYNNDNDNDDNNDDKCKDNANSDDKKNNIIIITIIRAIYNNM